MKAGDLVPLVRDNVEDPFGDFTPDDYVYRRLQMAQNALRTAVLENPNIGALLSTVELPNIPAGTRSLSSYFATGQPLAGLLELHYMRERAAGGPRTEADYVRMEERNELPAQVAGSFNEVFVVVPDDVLLLGATQTLDIKIFGKFLPGAIVGENSYVHPGTDTYLAFKAAALIAGIRMGMQSGIYQLNEMEAQKALDGYFRHIIMEKQKVPVRMKGFSRLGRFLG
jgi:hypothetical protein